MTYRSKLLWIVLAMTVLLFISVQIIISLRQDMTYGYAQLVKILFILQEYENTYGELPQTISDAVIDMGESMARPIRVSDVEYVVSEFDGSGGLLYNKYHRVLGINRRGWRNRIFSIPVQELGSPIKGSGQDTNTPPTVGVFSPFR